MNWPPQGDVLPVILRWVAFMLACVWSGINAWYWANLLYKTDSNRKQQQPRWFLYVRRTFGVLPLLAALVAMPLSARHGVDDTWFGMVCFAIAIALLLWFFAYRTTWFDERRVPKAYEKVDPDNNLVQGDRWFIRATLAISALILVSLLIPHWRTNFAWLFGPAALAYGAIGCIVPVTSYLIWKTRSQKIPVIMLGGLAFVLFSLLNDNHKVRSIDVPIQTVNRPTVEQALRRWEQGRSSNEPLVLVATAGGASRAAYWTGTVLRALDDRSNGQFSDHVFAISSVSGGALGAIGYAAWLADRPLDSESSPAAAKARLNFVQTFFGQDYLGPAVGALLFPDLIQRFLPAPLFPDRAASLEEAFELGWQQSATRCTEQPCPKSTRLADEYTQIWSKSRLHEDSGRWVPIVLANGTHVETGKRIITAPVRIDTSVFEDTYDFYQLAPAQIRASTAVLNSARFTVVSPPGRLMRGDVITGRIIDGGYFENGGMETVYDLARYLQRAMQPKRPIIIVEILNDDTMSSEDLRRHNENAAVPIEPPPTSEWPSPLLLEATSIIGGLYHTRSARAVLGAKRISDATASGLSDTKFYSFDLRTLNKGWYTAMSWALSLGTRDAMDVALNVTEQQIGDFLKDRNYTEKMQRTLTEDLLEVLGNSKENNRQLDAVLGALNANIKSQGAEPVTAAKRK
ncbi:patatin-like phospholipase family protein [Bradyrhizobium valentinum]|nr:patatin-like phospholipase family protein [Bradyrhizobium valentinum]